MRVTMEVKRAMRAHNDRRPQPCANDHWNAANNTGSSRGRWLCNSALQFHYGICCGPTRYKRVTEQIVVNYLIYMARPDYSWAIVEEVTA